jgi:hypothetical protein
MVVHIRKWKYSIEFGSLAAVFCLLICGCSMNTDQIEPHSLFLNTLQQIQLTDHIVQREDVGSVISQQSIVMNWNPLEEVERLKKGVTDIKLDDQQSNDQVIVLSTALDQSLAKQLLLEQLHAQLEAIRIEDPSIQNVDKQSLSATDKATMDNEIRAYIDQADIQLRNRLEASEVLSTMLLWVKRSTEKPIRIQFQTIIQDRAKSQQGNESLVDSYLIT